MIYRIHFFGDTLLSCLIYEISHRIEGLGGHAELSPYTCVNWLPRKKEGALVKIFV